MRAGDDRELLEREIGVIKELLQEQADSKCTDGHDTNSFLCIKPHCFFRVYGVACALPKHTAATSCTSFREFSQGMFGSTRTTEDR